MAQLFEDERAYQDNAQRKNFIFLAYPFTPALPADDYRAVMKDLQDELPLRLWYFLDEVTTSELMRKIWRAVLRSDMAFFDISKGNPNVAFELGLAVAENKRCITLLKTGEANPLGSADLGYSERAEYTSAATLKAKMRDLLTQQTSAMRLFRELSYDLHTGTMTISREQLEERIVKVVHAVFSAKKISKKRAKDIVGDASIANTVLQGLRAKGVLEIEGVKGGAKWVFAAGWVHHDHEVSGVV